jgi:hypothetical protein
MNILSTFIFGLFSLASSSIVKLDDSKTNVIRKAIKEHEDMLLLFTAKGCQACVDFEEVFEWVSKGLVTRNPLTKYGLVDTKENPGISMRFFITKIPNLIHIVNGQVYDLYDIRPELLEYFKEKRWKTMRPKNFFTGPFGILGTYLGAWGYVIHKGMDLQAKYNLSDKQMGLVFGTAVLGLIILIISVAFMFRPKSTPQQPSQSSEQAVPSIEVNPSDDEYENKPEESHSEPESNEE